MVKQQRILEQDANLALRGSQRERVVVVEVDNTLLVLGVTAQQITPLHQYPAPPRDEDTPAVTPGNDFRQLMRNVLNRPEK